MRAIHLHDDDAAIVFRGEMGAIDLDAPVNNEDGILLNGILAQALAKRCVEDQGFVDDVLQWYLSGDDSSAE